MNNILGYLVALTWGLTTVCAGIGYGRNIRLVMQGVEPGTDWLLVMMFTFTCVFTVFATSLVED